MNIFDIISIFYVLISIKVARDLIRNKESLLDDFVSNHDRALVTQAAFFFLIPIGVLLHELGHAIATWQVGGTVEEFQWRIFWGYILPSGDFTPIERWWISLSGNLVSILIGLIPIPFIRFVKKSILKELVRSFVKIELIYSLIIYPLFSFTAFKGDWVRIYNFSIKPYAQITLVLHLLLLLSLWRSGIFKERKE